MPDPVMNPMSVEHSESRPGTSSVLETPSTAQVDEMAGIGRESGVRVALLTGGDDRPYALGMASALAEQGIAVDFIGSDKLDAPQLHESPLITFLNLRGDQREDAPLRTKALRILAYY